MDAAIQKALGNSPAPPELAFMGSRRPRMRMLKSAARGFFYALAVAVSGLASPSNNAQAGRPGPAGYRSGADAAPLMMT